MFSPRALALSVFLSAALTTTQGGADTPTLALSGALSQLPDGGARLLREWTNDKGAPLLVQTNNRAAALAQGLVPISDSLAVGHANRAAWQSLADGPGIRQVLLSPFRYPFMDRVGEKIDLSAARNASGLKGEGTILGVVDTGGDPRHPALQDESGGSRIAWFLAFGREPLGLHPEIEDAYGCNGEDPCAVLSRADINDALSGGSSELLFDDPIGHGTHISSLAAGRDDDYPGVAQSADLVLVAASEPAGGVSDARILLGTKFVFDRATEMGRPAVVNVSLGSSFGAHDGTALVERGLADLARGPGRAIVLASGNSGSVLTNVSPDYPGPFGVHAEVAILPESEVHIPILSPPSTEITLNGSIFVWISTRPGDSISVGFSNGRKGETALVTPGTSGGISSDELGDSDNYDVILLNGVDETLDANVLPGSVVVAIVGSWDPGRAFELILEGHGNARLWLTGTGSLSPNATPHGPLFPRANSSGTVAVPGSHTDLITVGASINRNEWRDFSGALVGYGDPIEGRAAFSAAGPNQNGQLKPELVAPGAGVIGAMARSADPRTSLREVSQFASYGSCPDSIECFVIDDEHGIASGTSMAAPIVAGTVALLMQREPALTMERAKHYLMAGTHRIPTEGTGSLVGTGELDVVGALLAQERALDEEEGTPTAENSRVVWANDFIYPGTGPALVGYLLVRNAANEPVQLKSDDFSFSVEGPGRLTFENLAPGLVALQVTADNGTASEELTVTSRVRGERVARSTFVIERDPILAEYGYELTGGTCTLGAPRKLPPHYPALILFLGLLGLRRRARHRC